MGEPLRKIRVLVVDDSAFMRKFISDLINSQPDMEVVATARDGLDGLEKTALFDPDVITLDIEMPRLDGLGMLEELARRDPRPVVVLSSLTRNGVEITIRALDLGAVDFIAKPSGPISLDLDKVREELWQKIRTASRVSRWRLLRGAARRRLREPAAASVAAGTYSAGLLIGGAGASKGDGSDNLVVIGSSTGGPNALAGVIPSLPAEFPACAIVVQHMPPGFTRSMADHLNRLSAIEVKEAADGDGLVPGRCLVAPGGYHLVLDHAGVVALDSSAPRHGVRPSVDVTLESVARNWQGRLAVVIMTGMGHDGAEGARLVRERGGTVMAQDEASCVVYGMPRAVVERGLADQVLPLQEIAPALCSWARGEAYASRC